MPKFELTEREKELRDGLVRAVEAILLEGEVAAGNIGDHLGEYGTDSDYGAVVDGVVVDCMRVIVDNVGLM